MKEKGPWDRVLSASEQTRKSSFMYREGARHLVKSNWGSPLITLPTFPHLEPQSTSHLSPAHSFLILFQSQHPATLQSLGFSPLSPGHLTLIFLSFVFFSFLTTGTPTLPSVTILCTPTSLSLLLLSLFLSLLLSFHQGPHHWLCSHNDSVVLRWSKMSLICSNWGGKVSLP